MKQDTIMKACALFIFVLFAVAGYPQNTINNYKYVLVPERYNFSRDDNQYGLNTTTKFLLEQKGFVAFMSNEKLPPEVAANRCGALMADVVQKKGLFVTNLTLLLRDCQGNIIFKSKEGKSREKEFPVAFDLALRDAFSSLNEVPYKYDSAAVAQQQQAAAIPVAPSPAPAPVTAAVGEITGTLYAQATPNGYQLIDTSPKKVLVLLKTSMQDYFIAEAGASNGIVFKKDGNWFFEYYKDSKLVSQKLEIKF
ncbi:hypothetical protein Q4E93_02160 [Flavitalea sp. BT771]|uniref:hypothetical protein n=1 Tax=Flavitalea sp. BT771 TaxID=3063329 RepID=UPI0026E323FE|nr:hypothetical protein [Flavitalea sp. BT771]MDO6429374.1 hypothetical protein [Flavitalea sp. BT771]MDV6218498.1 hypothetical protein [Flavitalea sp. BT771]